MASDNWWDNDYSPEEPAKESEMERVPVGRIAVGKMPVEDVSAERVPVGKMAPQETAGLLDSLKSGVMSGMGTLGQGAGAAYVGLQEKMPAWLRRSDYNQDETFKAMEESKKYYDQASKDALGGKETGPMGAVMSGLGQVPFYAPLLAPMSIAGQGFQQAKDVVDEGGDLSTARKAYGVSTVTNAVFQGLPVALRGSLTKRILSGGALGALGVPIEPAVVNMVRKSAGLRELTMPEMKDYLAGTAIGAGAGGAFGTKGKAAPKAPDPTASKIDDMLADKPAEVTPPEAETPLPTVEGAAELPPMIPEVRGPEGETPLPPVEAPLIPGTEPSMAPGEAPLPRINEDLPTAPVEAPRYPPVDMTGAVPVLPDEGMPNRPLPPVDMEGAVPVRPETETPLQGVEPVDAPRLPEQPQGETPLPYVEGVGTPRIPGTEPKPKETPLPRIFAENERFRHDKREGLSDPKSAMVTWFKTAEDGTVNLRDTLTAMAADVKQGFVFPGYKKLMSTVLSYAEKAGITVRLVDELPRGATGMYFAHDNSIALVRGKGTNNYVLMHELVHGMTSRWLHMNEGSRVFTELDRIRQKAIEILGEDNHYGLKDVHELVAEAKTNPLFQQFMKDQKTGRGGNLWNNFVDAIKSIFRESGFKPFELNALDRILELTDPIPAKNLKVTGADIKALQAKREAEQMAKKGLYLSDIDGGNTRLANASMSVMRDPSTSMAPEALPERQNAAMANVPGMGGMKERISKDIPTAQIKSKILELGDISSAAHGAIGGKEMIASIKNHPAIYWLGSKLNNAAKRADLYHTMYLAPLAHDMIRVVSGKNGGVLATILKKEMFAKKRLTPDQLTELGLSEKDTTVYNNLREQFDIALKKMNDYRESTGQEPVTGAAAYLSSRWSGDWKTPVYNKDGKLVWYISETSKAKAEHALKYLEANHPELDISKSKVQYSKDFFMTEDHSTLATLTDMVAMLGKDDPAVKAMLEAHNERVGSEGEAVLGHKKHMEPKAGIRGFLGDRPWVNDKTNTADLFKSQMQYLSNTHRWVEMQEAVKGINEVIGDAEVMDAAPKLVNLIQDLKKAEIGYSTVRWIGAAERDASKFLGNAADVLGKAFPPLKGLSTDLSSINRGLGMAKSYFYITKLGLFNVPFATMSIVQPIFTVPHHVALSGDGYNHNPAQTWGESLMYGTDAFMAGATGDGYKFKGTGLMKDAYEYMRANGIGDLNQFSEAHDIGQSPMYNRAKKIAGMSMTESERFARSVAFMGYVSHLKQSGKFGDDSMAMFQKAEELTNKSMANYRHTERAGMFNKMGLAGNAAATLNTFKVNQYNQLYDFGKRAVQQKDPKPLLALMGTQFLMAGALGMYAIDEIEDLYNWFKKGAVKAGVLKDKDAMAWSPKHELAKHLDEWASYGAFSQVMGNRNFGSRMSAGNVVDPSFAGILPFANDFGKQITAAFEVIKDAVSGSDTTESGDRALHAVVPASMKPVVAMNSSLTDEAGNPRSTTKDSEGLEYRRTPEDLETMKGMMGTGFGGMQSVGEHKAREEQYRSSQHKSLVTTAQGVQSDRFLKAVRAGNGTTATKAIRDYIDLGGEVSKLVNSIDKSELRRLFTAQEWQAIQAKSTQQILELVRDREFRGVR